MFPAAETIWLKFAFWDRQMMAEHQLEKASAPSGDTTGPETASPLPIQHPEPTHTLENTTTLEVVPPEAIQQTPSVQRQWEDAWAVRTSPLVPATSFMPSSIDSHEIPNPKKRFMALTSLAIMWSCAQAPLFLFAAVPAYIVADIGGANHWVWFITTNLLASAAVSPFVGSLSDIAGRRSVALSGSLWVLIGQIVCGAAQDMGTFIAGMAMTGVGTGVSELTVLAGVSELVPVSQRGYYLAAVTLSVIPFVPSVMFAQLISNTANWRYISVLTAGIAAVALGMTAMWYNPPPQSVEQRQERQDKRKLAKKMDFAGGFFSIIGVVCIIMGLLGGGYQFEWTSVQVLCPLIIGICLLCCFGVWEKWATKYPMVPKRLGKAPRTLILTMVITFISGANFFAIIMIWPGQAYNVYGHEPVGVGIRGMPFAFGTLGGCIISLILLSAFRHHIKWILFGASALMTAGCGGLSVAAFDNMGTVYALLFIAGLGVGGIVVPASTVTTFICPPDFIATITSMTISVRIIGGAVGYAVYYNVFANKLKPELFSMIVEACIRAGITDGKIIEKIIQLTATSLTEAIRPLPGVTEESYHSIVLAGRLAFASAYPWVYYASIAFGGLAVVASVFLEDISEFIDDNVVVMI